MKYYAVFDTNVLVASLLTKRRDTATEKVINAISEGDIVPLYNQEILDEYNEVLHRTKFPFSDVSVQQTLTMIQEFGLAVSPSPTGEILPDTDNLVFYEVVMEKRSHEDAYLITGNIPIGHTVMQSPAGRRALRDKVYVIFHPENSSSHQLK